MLVPLSWLKRYVEIDAAPEDLAHRLTMAGVEVESIEKVGMHLDPELVVVGQVLKIEPHPNADRLRLPTVDLGNGETAKVVCGAPNVAVGQKIAFAKLGARLFNTHSGRDEPLRPAKIRGFESIGMVCSVRELKLGDDHEGILVLDPEAEIGSPLTDIIGDVLFDIAVTPNRPDCLSVMGIAHEVAALTGKPITEPEAEYPEDGDPIDGRVTVEIADPELCNRYTASLIEGVTVGPSPAWLQKALVSAGQRPINNVVDITNFVMLELNQPLHAFDFDLVKDATIIVRQARPGETLETLDGQSRKLQPPMLVIADSNDAVGLAGVMGGSNTEVSGGTTRILLESANFDPVNTRRTGADLKLSTGASYRFERGLRPELAEIGLRRATKLISEIAGGRVASGIIDEHPDPIEAPIVTLTAARLKQVLGVDIPLAKVREVLASVGFEPDDPTQASYDMADDPWDPKSVTVRSPYWRSDVTIEDDLVEEVARIIGYDEMPTTMLAAPIPHHRPRPAWDLKEHIRDALVGGGMREVINYNVVSEADLQAVGAWHDDTLALANPMNEEQRHLRTSLRASVLRTVSDNRRTSSGEGLRLFELGRVFLPNKSGNGLPDERETLVAAFSGRRSRPSWQTSDGAADMDFFDAKGAVESLLDGLGIEASFEPVEDPSLRPGRTAAVHVDKQRLGTVGEVGDDALAHFDLDVPGMTLALLEIDLAAVLAAAPAGDRRYSMFSRYPGSVRDLALIVDLAVSAEEIRAVLARHKLVKAITPFDVYTGVGVPEGKKSIAYELVFQSDKGTLTAEQIDRALEDLLRRLQRAVGAELRA